MGYAVPNSGYVLAEEVTVGCHSLTPVSRCWVAMAVNLCSEKFANMFLILLEDFPNLLVT